MKRTIPQNARQRPEFGRRRGGVAALAAPVVNVVRSPRQMAGLACVGLALAVGMTGCQQSALTGFGLNPSATSSVKVVTRTSSLQRAAVAPVPVVADTELRGSFPMPIWRPGTKVAQTRALSNTEPRQVTATNAYAPQQGLRGSFNFGIAPTGRVDYIRNEPSAHCRRILAEAGIDAIELRSPTIRADMSDNGYYGYGISYDLINLRRARITEDRAALRCHRDFLANRLQILLVTSTKALSRAGYLAMANSLDRAEGEFAHIKSRVGALLANGELTIQQANVLRQQVERIRARRAVARGEAARGSVLDAVLQRDHYKIDEKLMEIDGHLHALDRKMRTMDAFSVNAKAGYTQTEERNLAPGRVHGGGGFAAQISVSMKLGVLHPRRRELYDIAGQARQEEFHEYERGVLWRAAQIDAANQRMLSSLHQRRRDVTAALEQALANRNLSPNNLDGSLASSKLRAQIDILSLTAELAAIEATIADTARLSRKLTFKE